MSEKRKRIVSSVVENGEMMLVYALEARAIEVDGMWRASEAGTWGEFWAEMPPASRESVRNEIMDHYEYEERAIPPDHFPFDAVRDLPGHEAGDFLPWLQREMLSWVPAEIQQKFGQQQATPLNGDFLELRPEDQEELDAAFEAAGFEVVQDHSYQIF